MLGQRGNEIGVALGGGQQRVQAAGQGEVEARELDVREAAGERRVLVDVVARDDREHRLDVSGARVHGGGELVDPEVGRAEQADVAVRVGEGCRPVDERRAVGPLDRIEQAPLALRPARAADVGDDLDVAALDEVVALAREL